MFGISSVKLQRLIVTFSPVLFAGASVAVFAAGAVVGLDAFELFEFEFEFPHPARADDTTSNVEIPAKTRFILFILCLPFFLNYSVFVTAFIL
jgi:hypothetical protein